MGISEPVDFIFDYQEGMCAPVQEAWDALKKVAPPIVKNRLGAGPQFKKDTDPDGLPLQAADLLAWWIRRPIVDAVNGKPQVPFPREEKRQIELLMTTIEENDIREFFSTAAQYVAEQSS